VAEGRVRDPLAEELGDGDAGGSQARLGVSLGPREVPKRREPKGQDKGHAEALARFVAAVRAGGPAPMPEDELVESSLATIGVRESLQSGAPVLL